jgi:hypothetical protein
MSSIWTPGGEHRVPREPSNAAHAGGRGGHDDDDDDDIDDIDELDPDLAEAQAAFRDEIDAARERVAAVPAAQVVANHAMGIYELAAIHLSSQPPHFEDAALAIDALGTLVEGLGDRLGEHAPVLRDALHQIRLAFVQLKAATAPGSSSPE